MIFHGERGTPNGMAQLTPYPDGYFQLHGMTEDITLFPKGLVSSTAANAQPELSAPFIKKLTQHWQQDEVDLRSSRAINHMAQFIPEFSSATIGGKLYLVRNRSQGQIHHYVPLISVLMVSIMRGLKS